VLQWPMPRKMDNSGSIYRRGKIWWVRIQVHGRSVFESSKSAKKDDAVKLRDKMLGKRLRGELSGGAPDKVTIGELLDDVLKSDIAESTRYIWKKVIEKSIRPFFGTLKAVRLTTDKMDAYRAQRKLEGVADATVNRELSVLRTAYHNARKRTPPKVHTVPYFPMIKETTIRKGFLSDDIYARLRNELPQELKTLFVCFYVTGIRRSELLEIEWYQVDFDAELITLEKDGTKSDDPRTVPILTGDMKDLLLASYEERQANWPSSPWVFSRFGTQIKDFRGAWKAACKRAEVPELHIHDLRRTAVRNMRRAGVPQVVRMKISGHKTDSMERRYNIVDVDDLSIAKKLMEKRMRASRTVTKTVTTQRNKGIPGDRGRLVNSMT
jgi:integrase